MRRIPTMQLSLLLSVFCSIICASLASHHKPHGAGVVADQYFEHSAAKRINTDAVIYRMLVEQYPGSDITIVPAGECNLSTYAAAGLASIKPLTHHSGLDQYQWRSYQSPLRNLEGTNGTLFDAVKFGVYSYKWQDTEFTIYIVEGRDGPEAWSATTIQYIIGPRAAADELILAAGYYGATLHNEIWVFGYGFWQKDAQLWANMNKSSWDNVILDEEMKKDLIGNVLRFFDSQDQYTRLGVPWKRGIIFHGPPGNGKTISIKATMHTLYSRASPIPTLYVKTLAGYGEYSLGLIFAKAREESPCYLVFEDLDSLVTGDLRSYFLNEVDGLQQNDGILMVGSTNHLERLDPGISKRPSRFDRKFFFNNPILAQRVQYCEFWRKKLAGQKEVDFPVELVEAVAKITDGFSFAYIQEAFVASLLLIAADEDVALAQGFEKGPAVTHQQAVAHDGLDGVRLWQVIQEQVKILRQELETGDSAVDEANEKVGKTPPRKGLVMPMHSLQMPL